MGGCETFVRWQLLAGKTKVELQHESFSQEYNSKVFWGRGRGAVVIKCGSGTRNCAAHTLLMSSAMFHELI